jgi:hypothetical protein
MRDNASYETVAIAARRSDALHVRRRIIQYLGADPANPQPAAGTDHAGTAAPHAIPTPGLRCAAADALPLVRAAIWTARTGEPPARALSPDYLRLIRDTYTPAEPVTAQVWGTTWARDGELRYRAIAVLTSLPALKIRGMRTDHLAACLGVSQRTANEISTTTVINHKLEPPSLQRIGGWGGRATATHTPDRKRVTIGRCPHTGTSGRCPGWMDAVLLTPETLGLGASVVCSTCGKPESHAIALPGPYIAYAMDRLHAYQGSWRPCATPGCAEDFGAGPGQTWAWADDTAPPRHWPTRRCTAIAPTDGVPLRYAPCARPGCTLDTGHGPGIIEIHGRAPRKYHDACSASTIRERRRTKPSA